MNNLDFLKDFFFAFHFFRWNCVEGVLDGLNDFEHGWDELSYFIWVTVFKLLGAFFIEGVEFSDDVSGVAEVAIGVDFEVLPFGEFIVLFEFFGHFPVFRVEDPEVVREVSTDFAFAIFFFVNGEFGFKFFHDGGNDIRGFHELGELRDCEFFVSVCESEFEVLSFEHYFLR